MVVTPQLMHHPQKDKDKTPPNKDKLPPKASTTPPTTTASEKEAEKQKKEALAKAAKIAVAARLRTQKRKFQPLPRKKLASVRPKSKVPRVTTDYKDEMLMVATNQIKLPPPTDKPLTFLADEVALAL